MLIIDKVRNEITAGDDDVSEWIKKFARDAPFIKNTQQDKQAIDAYGDISDYVNAKYNKGVKEFLEGADAWLIAQARRNADTVILTREGKDNLREPKIPDVCKYFKVEYQIGIFDTLEELGAQFILDPADLPKP